MDNLPPELLRRILLHLITERTWIFEIHERVPKTSLFAYAAISRKWQSVVEPFTFRYMYLNPMRLDVAKAYNYFTLPRLAHLRYVHFDIEFPAHDLHVSTNPEDYDDQKVEWWLCDGEKMNTELRIRQRTEFAYTLKLLPKSIETFRLEYIRKSPTDMTFQPQSIVPPDATCDILSRELRRFSQRDGLKEFLVDASVDSSILWPDFQDPGSESPTWPNLSWFHVELNDVLPSGEWLDIRDPEDEEDEFHGNFDWDDAPYSEVPGDEYEKRFRCISSPIHFERFALATARAASKMPKIRELYLTHHGDAGMAVGFVTRALEKSCCLEFSKEPLPQPSEETMDAWRKVVKLHGLEWNVHFAYGADAYYFYTL
ncbi:F-box domain-containing protein [Fusarium sp. LHS14.1]|nr:F-box domain-containing protein [Fusarium sp. LHS14.1]